MGENKNNLYLKYLNQPFGMQLGTSDDGNGFIQQGRTNSPVSYNLILQPSGGNVGIGTTNPLYKLDVAGDGRFTGNVTAPTFN